MRRSDTVTEVGEVPRSVLEKTRQPVSITVGHEMP